MCTPSCKRFGGTSRGYAGGRLHTRLFSFSVVLPRHFFYVFNSTTTRWKRDRKDRKITQERSSLALKAFETVSSTAVTTPAAPPPPTTTMTMTTTTAATIRLHRMYHSTAITRKTCLRKSPPWPRHRPLPLSLPAVPTALPAATRKSTRQDNTNMQPNRLTSNQAPLARQERLGL